MSSSGYFDVVQSDEINTVFALTRHDTHADIVSSSLQNDKHIFVEKPLALNISQLDNIVSSHKKSKGSLVVGYNRRFSPLIKYIIKNINYDFPVSINYSINSGSVPHNHWINDMSVGGGRIIEGSAISLILVIFLQGQRLKILILIK